MDLDPWLARAAQRRPDHPALILADGAMTTYAELHAAARAAGAELAAAGVGENDRVALALPAGVPFVAALHATLMLGAAAVPIDLRLGEAEQALRARGAKVVVDAPLGSGAVAAPAAAVEPVGPHWLERLDPDAVATVIHTSGTTAAPKPVGLTIGNWHWNALGSALALGLDPEDRWLCTLPLSHVGGLSILLRSAIYATTVVLHERFDAPAVAHALAHERITLVSLVATTLQRTLDALECTGLESRRASGCSAVSGVEPTDAAQAASSPAGAPPSLGRRRSRAPHLRVALLGGGPLAPALADRARAQGIPVAQTYGMTEACSQVTTSRPGEPETAGWPLSGQRVRLTNDGEILVAGPTVAPGAADPATGWLHTGDLGELDHRGRLTVTGRKADTIVSGGENVAPQEVEAVLLAHPAVHDAGVYGRPDPEWGEAVVATVVLRQGTPATERELQQHVAVSLARFKVPKAIAFADSLPRTASGKLLRRQLG